MKACQPWRVTQAQSTEYYIIMYVVAVDFTLQNHIALKVPTAHEKQVVLVVVVVVVAGAVVVVVVVVGVGVAVAVAVAVVVVVVEVEVVVEVVVVVEVEVEVVVVVVAVVAALVALRIIPTPHGDTWWLILVVNHQSNRKKAMLPSVDGFLTNHIKTALNVSH